MNFGWLKRYFPRGLYGRAALILLLPIITLQIVVTVVFIQRYFEDITRQMTKNLTLDLKLLQEEIDTADTLAEAIARMARLSGPLGIGIELPATSASSGDNRLYYDLSGRIVILTLKDEIAAVQAVDLIVKRSNVSLWMETRYGPANLWLRRSRVSASNPHQFLVLVIFVSVVMTSVAFVFLRNQLRPIKRLAAAAEAFGRGHSVDYRPAGALEVRSAGNAFLDMRSRIERQITQRTMMLSGVSHDLRTPLTRFKLGLSVLENETDTADLKRDIADMERLLDAFLAFSRDDALGDLQDTDPGDLVRSVVDRIAGSGGAARLGRIDVEGHAMLQPMAIGRALENLIGNALRYGQNATVSVIQTGKSLKITVEDDGPGIPADLHDEALKPFARLDAARNQDRGAGVGLGLSIAQDIARRHGGVLRLGESIEFGGLQADIILPR